MHTPQLIAKDSKSAEIIKPYLRGRDVKKWRVHHDGLHIIFTRRGIDINNYPAIMKHLEQYKDRLTPGTKSGRKPGSYEWYEIQDNIAYFAEFEKRKITWGNLATQPQFAIAESGTYINAPANIITIDESKLNYLLGILNSKVTQFFIASTGATRQGGFIEYKPMYVSQMPIAEALDALRQQIASLAQQCLDVAKNDSDKLPVLEAELNQPVYQAYGLNEDDIALIEGHLG